MTVHHGESRRVHTLRTAAAVGITIAIAIAAIACTACNTTKGVGKDVEAAGEGLQGVADDTKDAIQD